MRKLHALSALGVAVLAPAVWPALAVAQSPEYTVDSQLKMTPKQAGTKDRPSGIKLNGRLQFSAGPDSETSSASRSLPGCS